ncbi:hypothetical protein C5167_044634 [Papaver somniferum]|uniref:Uncharacterized protein n=1 Tax=Papaver somniferum TaxID=3469 RepID=A0A4Y7L9Y4_PAPSO|nr:hypothetical protein C5167_044634 [Papaver somniferum]
MPQYQPPTISSQTYTYDQAGHSILQLPNLEWDMPFYKDSFTDLVTLPKQAPNPYNFNGINVWEEESRKFTGEA